VESTAAGSERTRPSDSVDEFQMRPPFRHIGFLPTQPEAGFLGGVTDQGISIVAMEVPAAKGTHPVICRRNAPAILDRAGRFKKATATSPRSIRSRESPVDPALRRYPR